MLIRDHLSERTISTLSAINLRIYVPDTEPSCDLSHYFVFENAAYLARNSCCFSLPDCPSIHLLLTAIVRVKGGSRLETIPDSPSQVAHRDYPNTLQQMCTTTPQSWASSSGVNTASTNRVFRHQTPPDIPAKVHVQLLTLLISKQGFLAEYFPQSCSDAVPPQGCWARTYLCLYGNNSFLPGPFFFFNSFSIFFLPSSGPTQV